MSSLKITLNAVEISISLFDPAYKASNIAVKRTNNRSVHFPKFVRDFIRKEKGLFKSADIANRLCQKKGIELSEPTMIQLKQNVLKAIKRLRDQGVVIEAGRSGMGGGLQWHRVAT